MIDLRKFLGISLVLLGTLSPIQAKYRGGSGTAQDPYQIATAADLMALGETLEDYDKHFILTADSGSNNAGGLVGGHDLVLWLPRPPDQVSACFWDNLTSGQTVSDGGTGGTTAEMQTANTFLEAGWDFIGEDANGTNEIWWILEGKDYPRLWWELNEAVDVGP